MFEWLYGWEMLDAALLCVGLGLAVRFWQRVSASRHRDAAAGLERLRTYGS